MTHLAFSTLGCPGLPLDTVCALARRHGFSGVELRAGTGEPVHIGLDAASRAAAAGTLRSSGVRPLSIASYVRLAGAETDAEEGSAVTGSAVADDAVVADGLAHGLLAADIGAPFLRVFPGGAEPTSVMREKGPARRGEAPAARHGDPAGRDDEPAGRDEVLVRRLARIVDGLAGSGVTVAVETHDAYSRGSDVAHLIGTCPGATAIWDVLHPWRSGEPITTSYTALADRLAYVQVKDVASPTDLTPLAPGDGMLPLADIAGLLRTGGYDGWVSWEYEHAWFPHRPPLSDLAGTVAARLRDLVG